MNMVLSDVEETIYVVDVDEITNASVVRVSPAASDCPPGSTADSRPLRLCGGMSRCSLSAATALFLCASCFRVLSMTAS